MEILCYNGLGRITSDGANTYTYDGNGNLLTRGTNEAFTYDWKFLCFVLFEGRVFLNGENSVKAAFENCNLEDLVRYQNTTDTTDMYYAYDIGNVRLAKGKMTEVSSSRSTDRLAKSRKMVITEGRDLVSTTTTRTTPRNFAELGLTWQEFYHKSDNISVRTLDISLDTPSTGWNWTEFVPNSHDTASGRRTL